MTADCSENRVGGMTARDAFSDERVVRLVQAGDNNNLEAMDEVILAGADVNAIGREGITPLMWFYAGQRWSAMERLLRAGANPNYKDPKQNYSAMAVAAGGAYPDILKMLLKYGGDPNARGLAWNQPLLTIAISENRKENIEILLRNGANINIHEPNGNTPATVAASLGQFDMVALLLESGLKYDLQRLARYVDMIKVPPGSDAQQWKDKVIEMLKERGARFPAFDPKNPARD